MTKKKPTKDEQQRRWKKARDLAEVVGVVPSTKTEEEKDEIARRYLKRHEDKKKD